MSRSSRFFHSALDFLHGLHSRVKHVVKPIAKASKRKPKAVRRLSSESKNMSVTEAPEENNEKATPITRLVCQTCEAAKIAQSVTAGRKLDVTCKTALGTCVVGGLVTPPKLEREKSNRWIPKVTKHKRKAKKEVTVKKTSSDMKQGTAAVAINVQPPSPQKVTSGGGGGCCGGGCGCGSSKNTALPPLISTPTNKPDVTAATALATPGGKGALLAVATRTPRKPTLKALSTPIKTPKRRLATPSLRRRSATPRRSPRNNELRRVAQAGRAGRTATMVGLGSLMGARAFAGGSVAFLGVNLSTTGIQGSTAQSVNSPRLLIVADNAGVPGTPRRSPWHIRPRTPYHNHIRSVRTSSVTNAKLSASPIVERMGKGSDRMPSHHQLLSSGLKTPRMRSPVAKAISPIPFHSTQHTPVKTTPRGVMSAFEGRFTKTPQISYRSTPLGTRRKPDPTMSLSSAIKAAGITAKPADLSDLEDVFEPPNDFTAITAIGVMYTEEVLFRKYV
ncbi:uncharacterized protein [Branchiostoma lanceolatum]|uniref:uncharacterized protein n=1 Tax=Branchiostoma lanceolatum TaxID=7740 RepID=UPI0034553ABD